MNRFRCSAAVLSVAVALALSPQVAIGSLIVTDADDLVGRLLFDRITNNGPDVASQMAVDVYDVGNTQVLFIAQNLVPDVGSAVPSTIKKILFDDGALLGLAEIYNDVVFGAGIVTLNLPGSPVASPLVEFLAIGLGDTDTLPGGNALPFNFQTTAGFGVDAVPPPAKRGVDPGEAVGLVFDLIEGMNIGGLWDALNHVPTGGYNPPGGGPDGSLRIGLHVISEGEDEEESDGYINRPPGDPPGGGGDPPPIPEPASLVIWGLGLMACAAARFRRRRKGPE